MKKVIIIGSPGSGKSTFARKLSDASGLPLYYLDMMWHRPDRTNVSHEEFDACLKEIMQKEEWIIDGNYLRTIEVRLRECDTVFLLDIPLEVCLEGIKSRIGKSREDMPWIETELDEEFRQWVVEFPEKHLPQIYELIDIYKDSKNIFIFESRREADDYLNTVFSL